MSTIAPNPQHLVGHISAVGRIFDMRPRSLALLGRIPSPHPFNGMRQELRLGIANAVASVSAEKILVLVALGLQYLGHAVVGLDPVVHPVAHDVGVQEISVPY